MSAGYSNYWIIYKDDSYQVWWTFCERPSVLERVCWSLDQAIDYVESQKGTYDTDVDEREVHYDA